MVKCLHRLQNSHGGTYYSRGVKPTKAFSVTSESPSFTPAPDFLFFTGWHTRPTRAKFKTNVFIPTFHDLIFTLSWAVISCFFNQDPLLILNTACRGFCLDTITKKIIIASMKETYGNTN